MNPTKIFKEFSMGLTISSAIITLAFFGTDNAYAQTMSMSATNNNNTA
jgi:hypothetical protein